MELYYFKITYRLLDRGQDNRSILSISVPVITSSEDGLRLEARSAIEAEEIAWIYTERNFNDEFKRAIREGGTSCLYSQSVELSDKFVAKHTEPTIVRRADPTTPGDHGNKGPKMKE